jgi:hypothetical protein
VPALGVRIGGTNTSRASRPTGEAFPEMNTEADKTAKTLAKKATFISTMIYR